MGTTVLHGCCETKNSSSNLGIRTENHQGFDYQDDEPLTITPSPYSALSSNKKLSLKFPSNFLHISKTIPYEVPVCLKFETGESPVHPGTDLLIILDLTSHSSVHLPEIKSFLQNLLKDITINDRVSIIGYNTRVFKLSGLVVGNFTGVLKLNRIIEDLSGEGEADIIEAVSMGLLLLKNRIFVNNNTSILLVSSAPDAYNSTVLERSEWVQSDLKDLNTSLTAIGLSESHNSELLNFLSVSGDYHYFNDRSWPSKSRTVTDALFKKKLYNLSVSLSVSSVLQVEITKIFHHAKHLEYGKNLCIVFIMSIKQAFEDVKDRVHINAKLSHKFDCVEASASVDVYGKSWNLEDMMFDEEVMNFYFKEKTVETLLMAIDKDFMIMTRIIDNVLTEALYSALVQSKIFTQFLRKLQDLRESLQAGQSFENRNKALLCSFIRNHWGKGVYD